MIILALDSTAVAASVALLKDGKLLGEFTVNNGNTHSETLLPMVESLLKQNRLTIADIDAFAVSVGPGSFTGVRIGVATVKGLAFGQNKPCYAVSTLESLAENLACKDGLICPVMNARRNQFYTALFRAKEGKLTRITEDSALSFEELDAVLEPYKEPISLCGDGYSLAKELLKTKTDDTPERLLHQSAFSVATVAYHQFLNQSPALNDRELKPFYLRPSQAERERAERENKE